jgi:para-nitrobenzyl esterase
MSTKSNRSIARMFETTIDRRTVLRRSICAGGALVLDALMGGVFTRSALAAASSSPVVETTAGKVRGLVMDGIQSFKGIPYGASTAGANRFMPPQKPLPWAGVKEVTQYGSSCPQFPRGQRPDLIKMIRAGGLDEVNPHRGEDCLVLNVWTRGSGGGQKRPVMIYFHGGAYIGGTGGAPFYDGSKLARQDIVAVTCNHRLNLFGFLYLADLGGAKYVDSGNASMLDLVLALQWIRDNIAQFGGDPNNVTIFGESGGGSKVSVMTAMPAGAGLFHKAALQSGSALRARTREEATKAAEKVLADLGLKANQLDELHKLPTERLLAASAAGGGFGPVVDGRSLPNHPYDPVAPSISAKVPMIIGSTKEETVYLIGDGDPSAFILDEAGLKARIAKTIGDRAEAADTLIALYRKKMPNASPSDLFFEITTELGQRENALTQVERKIEQRGAPAYMYVFTWQSLGFGGKYKAFHASDVPFPFDNVDKAMALANNDPKALALSRNISRAWVAFARNGDPNHPDIPQWKSYSLKERPTMIFDNECKAVNDPFRDERLAVAALGGKPQT